MCPYRALFWLPIFWSQLSLSLWQAGAATRTEMLNAVRKQPLSERTLRTHLLSLHVSTLTPTPAPTENGKRGDTWLRSV